MLLSFFTILKNHKSFKNLHFLKKKDVRNLEEKTDSTTPHFFHGQWEEDNLT